MAYAQLPTLYIHHHVCKFIFKGADLMLPGVLNLSEEGVYVYVYVYMCVHVCMYMMYFCVRVSIHDFG